MIHYTLRCGGAHEFDGWFADSVAFEAQSADGRIACPSCGRQDVARALMAPAVRRRQAASAVPAPPPAGAPDHAAPAPPAALLSALQKLRAEVERQCEHVGADFADQALAMHRGVVGHRHIYGDATEEDARMLRDEGVAVAVIPWVARADS